MLKMSRFTRMGNIFKCTRDHQALDDSANHDVSKIGSRLSDKISKKIIIGVLFMLILIPVFEESVYEFTDLESECNFLQNIYEYANLNEFQGVIDYRIQNEFEADLASMVYFE